MLKAAVSQPAAKSQATSAQKIPNANLAPAVDGTGAAEPGSSSNNPRTPPHDNKPAMARPPSIGDLFKASTHATTKQQGDADALDTSARDLDVDPDLVQKRALLCTYPFYAAAYCH